MKASVCKYSDRVYTLPLLKLGRVHRPAMRPFFRHARGLGAKTP